MAFPIGPADGATTTVNGINYTYSSADNAWSRVAQYSPSLDANVGAFELYANANIGTLYLGNISTQANLGAYQTWANANVSSLQNQITGANTDIQTTSANLGAFQTYANANIGTLFTGNNVTNANLGAFEAYANTKIGTNTNSNLVVVASTISTNTTSGALVVGGGVGIQGNINVGSSQGNSIVASGTITGTANVTQNLGSSSIYWGTAYAGQFTGNGATIGASGITATGNIAVNTVTDAAITTTTTVAEIFNSGATTLKIGGAATTINIGATTGGIIPAANAAVNLGSTTAYWGTTFTGALLANTATFGGGNVTVSSNINATTAGTAGRFANVITTNGMFWANGITYGSTYTASATAPTSPKINDEWYYTTTDTLYKYSTDGTNTFWLDINSPYFYVNTAVTGTTLTVAGLSTLGTVVATGNIVAASGINSTSTITGALTVPGAGGAGIGGDVWIGGAVRSAGNIVAASGTAGSGTTNGALVVVGGAGISGITTVGGNLVAAATTTSTSTTTGALVVAGGAGIAGQISSGNILLTASPPELRFNTGGSWLLGGSNTLYAGIGGTASPAGAYFVLTSTGNVVITGTTTSTVAAPSSTPTTGALVVKGGTSIVGNLQVGGNVIIGTPSAVASNNYASGLTVHSINAGSSSNYFDPGNYAAHIFNQINATSRYGLLVSDYWRSSENYLFSVDGRYYVDGTVANDQHNPYFIVRGDGQVGIGTNAPTQKLEVNGSIAVTGSVLPTANLTYNLGSTTGWWSTVYGKSVQAQYADLAEMYTADDEYGAGTVVIFGGTAEVTTTTITHDTRVAGVVSTNPAYLMNANTDGTPVAMTGRVPCLVRGPVAKGMLLVASDQEGVAEAINYNKYKPGCVLGKSLAEITDDSIQTIEVVVGRF